MLVKHPHFPFSYCVSECDCVSQPRTLNQKLEEAKPSLTNVVYCFETIVEGNQNVTQLRFSSKYFLNKNDQTAWGLILLN